MAVVNTKATAISNADAKPNILNPPHLDGSYIRQKVGTVEVVSGDTAPSVYRVARLRSNDRVSSIGIANDALGASAACKIGLYETAANGGAAVSDALFATGLSLVSASATFTNQAWNNLDVAKAEKRVWELLGLTADPNRDYDLAITVTNMGATGAGTLSAHVAVVAGN